MHYNYPDKLPNLKYSLVDIEVNADNIIKNIHFISIDEVRNKTAMNFVTTSKNGKLKCFHLTSEMKYYFSTDGKTKLSLLSKYLQTIQRNCP